MTFEGEIGLKLKLLPPNSGCPECATEHDPTQPHNWLSPYYQFYFYQQHGRWPTWADAMAHCACETQALWKACLAEEGLG